MKISLRAARTNAGLTISEMAKACNTSRNRVIDWELGRRPLTEQEKYMYCNICGCKASDVECDVLILRRA